MNNLLNSGNDFQYQKVRYYQHIPENHQEQHQNTKITNHYLHMYLYIQIIRKIFFQIPLITKYNKKKNAIKPKSKHSIKSAPLIIKTKNI